MTHLRSGFCGEEQTDGEILMQMDVMIFGATSPPSTAQAVKNCNAEEFAKVMPEAADAILRKHYVDDYLDSVDDDQDAVQRIRNVIQIHRSGGFEMRNWISSSRTVLKSVPGQLRSVGEIDIGPETELPIERTLGLRWNQNSDVFTFTLFWFQHSPSVRSMGSSASGPISISLTDLS